MASCLNYERGGRGEFPFVVQLSISHQQRSYPDSYRQSRKKPPAAEWSVPPPPKEDLGDWALTGARTH